MAFRASRLVGRLVARARSPSSSSHGRGVSVATAEHSAASSSSHLQRHESRTHLPVLGELLLGDTVGEGRFGSVRACRRSSSDGGRGEAAAGAAGAASTQRKWPQGVYVLSEDGTVLRKAGVTTQLAVKTVATEEPGSGGQSRCRRRAFEGLGRRVGGVRIGQCPSRLAMMCLSSNADVSFAFAPLHL